MFQNKIVAEEITEGVEEVCKSTAPDSAKRIARKSYDVNAKSDTQVFMLFLSHLINRALGLSNRDWMKLCNEKLYT
jgi:hypothetical protein